MTDKISRDQGLEALERALDTYGADRTRWPADTRRALAGLITGNADARRMLAEAEAFDQLLDAAAAEDGGDNRALVDRIVAAAERQPRVVHGRPAAVIPRPALGIGRREQGWAAAALAASLMLGVLAGGTTALTPAAQVLVGAATDSDGAGQQMAQSEDSELYVEEELL